MNKKLTVGLLFGGKSVEHEISIRSAKNIAKYIDKKFNVVYIGVSKNGEWYYLSDMEQNITSGKQLKIRLSTEKDAFYIPSEQKYLSIDVIFSVLHGTNGEDGSVQGLLKVVNIPSVGSEVLGSAITMDKIISKKLMEASKIPVTNYLSFTYREKEKIKFDKIKKHLGLPFMVKSSNLGSSVGISKVENENEFDEAVNDSFKYANEILFETFITGKEIECAVIGNKNLRVSTPGEIVFKKNFKFYTYQAKYLDEGGTDVSIPASLDVETIEKVKQISLKAYEVLKCNDYARVDLLVDKDNNIYVNEINSLPGFTNISMFPMLCQYEFGLDFTSLITELINLCIERCENTIKLESSYV